MLHIDKYNFDKKYFFSTLDEKVIIIINNIIKTYDCVEFSFFNFEINNINTNFDYFLLRFNKSKSFYTCVKNDFVEYGGVYDVIQPYEFTIEDLRELMNDVDFTLYEENEMLW